MSSSSPTSAAPSQRERARVPAGVRAGGEFTTQARAESDVTLGDADGDRRFADLVEMSADDRGEALARQALLSGHHQVHVRNLRFISPEDLAQDTIALVLEARANAVRDGRAPRIATEAYVQQIAGGFGAIAARGALRAEDHKAIGIFTRRVSEIEAESGRTLSSRERDDLAAQIRDSWPDQRHKPSKDFVRLASIRTYSLDAKASASEDKDRTFGDLVSEQLEASGSNTDSVDPDSEYRHVMDMVEAKQTTQARRHVWDALAELNGAPKVTVRLNRAKRLSARMAVSDAGGVVEVVRRWSTTGQDCPASDAVFLPFGSIGTDQRDAVADMLLRNRDRAEDLYSAALLATDGVK